MATTISRAFTTKRNKPPPGAVATTTPPRSSTTKQSARLGTIRYKISAPVELLSTTNMLSYNAPDIHPARSRSGSSGSESDLSQHSPNMLSPLTSPDTSSVESSPTSLSHNHLSNYFTTSSRRSASSDEVPSIPTRAVSHTKKSAETTARQRSISRGSSPQNSVSTARSSIQMFSSNVSIAEPHPFGKELAQVSELAEVYGISQETLAIVDEEEQELLSRGLFKFGAEDYMNEIHGLYLIAFGESKPATTAMWI